MHLEEVQVVVQLAFLRSSIETHATSVQQDTDEPDPKEVVGHVNLARVSRERTTVGCKPNVGDLCWARLCEYLRWPNVTNDHSMSKMIPEPKRR